MTRLSSDVCVDTPRSVNSVVSAVAAVHEGDGDTAGPLLHQMPGGVDDDESGVATLGAVENETAGQSEKQTHEHAEAHALEPWGAALVPLGIDHRHQDAEK